jgi:hypothetical protein
MKEIDRKIGDRATQRKTELSKLDPKTLRDMPEYTSEQIEIDDQQFNLSIYHHKTNGGEDLIVVQGYRETGRFLGMIAGNIHAHGFVLHSDGSTTEAEDRLLWDFK